MGNCHVELALLRAASALQVAVHAWLDNDYNDRQGYERELAAMVTIQAEIAKLVKQLKAEMPH